MVTDGRVVDDISKKWQRKGKTMISNGLRYGSGLCMSLLAAVGFGAIVMPEVVSHRGESLDRPENTIAAFQLAFERGVDGVECDVYATTDDVPVIIHDSTTGRTSGAGSGNGLTVTASTWDQLKDVQVGKFGSWVGTEWESQTLPKFEDYLALLSLNTTTRCIVELKGNGANNLAANVAAAVRAQPLATPERVVFIAFDASLIRAIRTALPNYDAWLLLSRVSDTAATIISKIQACNATGVDIEYESAICGNADGIAAVKDAGYTFAVWTCDNTDTAWTLTQNGVESITTNKGKVTKDFLAEKVAEVNNYEEMVDPDFPEGTTLLDVGSYVQNGLVGHFDAIRNAGADLPHDNSATVWKNLAGSPDATFTHRSNSPSPGFWTAKSYFFNNGTMASTTDAMNLGENFTVQIAVNAFPGGQTGTTASNNQSNKYNAWYNDNPKENRGFWTHSDTGTTMVGNFNLFCGDNHRINLTGWQGKYVTWILDGANGMGYTFQTPSRDAGMSCPVTTANKAMKQCWGGEITSAGVLQAFLKGDYHSVRMYTRVLTDPELVWNRIVDDARFRGAATNGVVVVASNRAGLEGVEANGEYFVNGSHTFTAPETATLNGNTYACAGYKLEYWDAAKNGWVFDSNQTERQFAYTRCDAVSGARITWNWRLTDGVKKYDADDYVQAGLLLQFDGIRNAGLDAEHDAAATVWKNLGSLGGVNDAALSVLNAELSGAWAATGYAFKGGDYFALGGTVTIDHQATTQVAADFNETFIPTGTKWPHFFGHPDDRFNIYVSRNGNNTVAERGDLLNFKADATTGFNSQNRSLLQPWDGRLINAILDYNRSSLSDGAAMSWKNGTYKSDVWPSTYCIGAAGGDNAAKLQRAFEGRIYSVRLYDRPLTTAELQQNLEVDTARFYGGAGRSTETDLVEVRSEVPDIALDDAGCYLIRGTGSKSFSAPETVTVGTRTYRCAGYRTEIWNVGSRQWVNPVVTENATTCEVSGTDGVANRRITWLWTLTAGVRNLADYDVADYVQQGLVANYDGIHNAGMVNGHALKGMYWRDLSYRGNNLLAASNTCHTAWVENGCHFATEYANHMRMVEKIDLGVECTFQSVLDTVPASQTVAYPTYFGAPNDQGMFTRGAGNALEWKNDDWCVSGGNARAILSGWAGKYINAIVTTDRVYLSQGTTLNYSVANTKKKVIDGKTWSIGSSNNTVPAEIGKRAITGDYFAFRLYNRPLSEAELEQNMKVDEIRFRGNTAPYRDVTVVN
ncbi:MAG: hypothetical protein J6336_00995, partial [Kiritimatiellae bacterium]|nr:hypothetical protein [Kiritimatiellia bacterium]